MRKFFITISILLTAIYSFSQELGQVTFTNGATFAYFSFRTDQGVLIRVSDDGKVLEWGMEVMSDRSNYYAPKLQPFMGRVEYYGPEDSVFKGKLKSIGTCFIKYYDAFETEEKVGKLKSLGTLYLDYYSKYDEKSLRGKLRFIGGTSLEYYSTYENEAYRGKLKAIGNSAITYYSAFDDKKNSGKIKSIGTVTYTWYSDFGRSGLKTGYYRQVIGSVTYILN